MGFETDVFVDTEAYDTSEIPVVNLFFSKLFPCPSDGSISCCDAGGDSDGVFDTELFLEPGNFTRTDPLAEFSCCVSVLDYQSTSRPLRCHSVDCSLHRLTGSV